MNTKILMLAAALSTGLGAHAQSPGTSAGASAGGSSAFGRTSCELDHHG
jgi:hypothetical protein